MTYAMTNKLYEHREGNAMCEHSSGCQSDLCDFITRIMEANESYLRNLMDNHGNRHAIDITQVALLSIIRTIKFIDECMERDGVKECLANPVTNSACHSIELFVNNDIALEYLLEVLPECKYLYDLLRSEEWKNFNTAIQNIK